MPIFNPDPNTANLSKDEKKWCRQMENLLKRTPERFGLYTIGDPSLGVFDRVACEERGIEQHECLPGNHGLDLASLEGSEDIQGWAG